MGWKQPAEGDIQIVLTHHILQGAFMLRPGPDGTVGGNGAETRRRKLPKGGRTRGFSAMPDRFIALVQKSDGLT